jgi:hypothetical protein
MRVIMVALVITIPLVFITNSVIAGSIDVSGYTDKDVYVHGELDVSSGGSAEGYLHTERGSTIYIQGDIESGGEVYVYSDSWGGGGYYLDID